MWQGTWVSPLGYLPIVRFRFSPIPLLLTACLADPLGQSALVPSSVTSLSIIRNGPTNVTLLGAWALAPDRAWAAGQAR